MRRALPIAIVCAALLIALGLPALHVRLGDLDARVLPPNASARVVDTALSTQFSGDQSNPVIVVAHAPVRAAPALATYARHLGALPDVAFVRAPLALPRGLWEIDLYSRTRALSATTEQLVQQIRAGPAPYPIGVTGRAAGELDRRASLMAHLPAAFAILAGSTLLILFAMTGSVLLPIKSLIMNLLTLCGAFGVLVLVFQDGNLHGLLGFTSSGSLDQTNMVILAVIAFGLSTDYGVFLLARIKEGHDAGLPDREAVAVGLERSGRVVTAAALLFCAAVGALVTSQLVFIKEFGVGAALAVLIDATVVRALLVPSLMALFGRANWWAPPPLRRIRGNVVPPTPAARGPALGAAAAPESSPP
jgi:RND superfamily putative drug exporter